MKKTSKDSKQSERVTGYEIYGNAGNDLIEAPKGRNKLNLSMGHDTVEGFGRGDALELPEDLLETGMKASDLRMTTGRLDRRKALRISFELDGRQHATFLGNRRQIKAARTMVQCNLRLAGADQTLTSTGGTLQNNSLQIDAFNSNDTIVAAVAFSAGAQCGQIPLTQTSGIKPATDTMGEKE